MAERKRSGRSAARHLALAGALGGALLAGAVPTQAQQTPRDSVRRERLDPEQRLERRVQMLTERLELSTAQANDVRALFREEAERMQAALAEAGMEPRAGRPPRGEAPRRPRQDRERPDEAEREALREAMAAVRERTDEGLARILTPEQLEEYRALEAPRRGRMEARRRG